MLLFVDQLCNVDFSYIDPDRGLVGETWIASIELEGALDEQGMVCDFGTVKAFMRKWLDDNVDHKLLIPGAAEYVKATHSAGYDEFTCQTSKGHISGRGPAQAHCFIDDDTINPESVGNWCLEQIQQHFPDTISSLKLGFYTEQIHGPYYHYSHGLKKHSGNCQRIAHGHRSKIEIWKNGKLDQPLMKQQSARWQDIYIGTRADLIEQENNANFAFRYQSQQGEFELSLPKASCYLIDSDSTVEFIAQHILESLKSEDADSAFRVKAYEGLAKGAIASSKFIS